MHSLLICKKHPHCYHGNELISFNNNYLFTERNKADPFCGTGDVKHGRSAFGHPRSVRKVVRLRIHEADVKFFVRSNYFLLIVSLQITTSLPHCMTTYAIKLAKKSYNLKNQLPLQKIKSRKHRTI